MNIKMSGPSATKIALPTIISTRPSLKPSMIWSLKYNTSLLANSGILAY